ncbi:MAG: hypothetical protein ABI132_11395 [Rhodanobacteraceae bacterium]
MFEKTEKDATTWFHWLECVILTSLTIYLAINASLLLVRVVLTTVACISAIALFILTALYSLPLVNKITGSFGSRRRTNIFSALAGALAGLVVAVTVMELVKHGQ